MQIVYVVLSLQHTALCEVFSTLDAAERFKNENTYTKWVIFETKVREE